jgi:hypothetical protein
VVANAGGVSTVGNVVALNVYLTEFNNNAPPGSNIFGFTTTTNNQSGGTSLTRTLGKTIITDYLRHRERELRRWVPIRSWAQLPPKRLTSRDRYCHHASVLGYV